MKTTFAKPYDMSLVVYSADQYVKNLGGNIVDLSQVAFSTMSAPSMSEVVETLTFIMDEIGNFKTGNTLLGEAMSYSLFNAWLEELNLVEYSKDVDFNIKPTMYAEAIHWVDDAGEIITLVPVIAWDIVKGGEESPKNLVSIMGQTFVIAL
ncbi:hypothetical protein [Vibrio cholerae]|uniref:hypothetical protein n=1 Tax=Vibrio cholerae TaxID=666 RepID=UPI003D6B108F